MSKTNQKEPSPRFLKLLRLSMISFVSMGILIGYHGAPLINSLIGVFWLLFTATAGMVVHSALSKDTGSMEHSPEVRHLNELKPGGCDDQIGERRRKRSAYRQNVFD